MQNKLAVVWVVPDVAGRARVKTALARGGARVCELVDPFGLFDFLSQLAARGGSDQQVLTGFLSTDQEEAMRELGVWCVRVGHAA